MMGVSGWLWFGLGTLIMLFGPKDVEPRWFAVMACLLMGKLADIKNRLDEAAKKRSQE